jgi:hypothetical protein
MAKVSDLRDVLSAEAMEEGRSVHGPEWAEEKAASSGDHSGYWIELCEISSQARGAPGHPHPPAYASCRWAEKLMEMPKR